MDREMKFKVKVEFKCQNESTVGSVKSESIIKC